MNDAPNNTDDKRRRLRIHFSTQVHLEFRTLDRVINGQMKDISMNGLYVITEEHPPLNTPCHIKVIINAPHSSLTMETQGSVSRHDDHGIGIEFTHDMEWFAFFSIFSHYGKE